MSSDIWPPGRPSAYSHYLSSRPKQFIHAKEIAVVVGVRRFPPPVTQPPAAAYNRESIRAKSRIVRRSLEIRVLFSYLRTEPRRRVGRSRPVPRAVDGSPVGLRVHPGHNCSIGFSRRHFSPLRRILPTYFQRVSRKAVYFRVLRK